MEEVSAEREEEVFVFIFDEPERLHRREVVDRCDRFAVPEGGRRRHVFG
jgi:hypothetical protein